MFDENDEIDRINLTSICSYCNKKIKLMSLNSLDRSLRFCDIVCAKLYYDNVSQFDINRNEYNDYYINDQLSKRAKELYANVGSVIFKTLPIYKPNEKDEVYGNTELMKRKYFKIITPVLFK